MLICMTKEYTTKVKTWLMGYFDCHMEERNSAKELYAKMRDDGLPANLSTIYRNLEKLVEERVLAYEEIPGVEERRYVYHKPEMACDHHLHLYCVRCGSVFHLNCGFMDEIQNHLNEEHGFLLNCEKSVLMGICKDCRKEEE